LDPIIVSRSQSQKHHKTSEFNVENGTVEKEEQIEKTQTIDKLKSSQERKERRKEETNTISRSNSMTELVESSAKAISTTVLNGSQCSLPSSAETMQFKKKRFKKSVWEIIVPEAK